MKARNLTNALKGKTHGWVAVNSKNEAIAYAKSYAEINKKTEKLSEKIILVPAAKEYFGYITFNV